MMLWNYIREKMLEHPEQIVCEGDATMTYEELCVFAEERGKTLEYPFYGILCNSEMASAMALLACISAEKTAIPFPFRYGKEYYLKLWEEAAPPCMLTDRYGDLKEAPFCSECEALPLPPPAAVILYTSGSTGTPKGVMLSEENLLSNIKDISSYFPIGSNDTILISRPLYHSSVLTGEFLVALCSGAKIVFSSEPFQPLNMFSLVKKHRVTILGNTPTLLSTLSRFIRKGTEHSVRLLSVSGECMTEGMAKTIRNAFPNAEIYCGYGLSEASPRVAYLPAQLFDQFPTSAGVPLPCVSLKIVDEHGKAVELGEIGELVMKGPNVMKGYFRDPKRTQTALKNGWLHTGDLAYIGPKGMLYIKGRKDDMIIRAGMNIYPAEVENLLSSDSRVKDVLVYGYSKGDTQEVGMKISGDFLDVKEVMELCRRRLSNFQLPSKVELIDNTEVFLGGKKRRKT